MSDFSSRLIRWHTQHGRHNLPWQNADAYRIWLSEIMLQQTQVATVIPYYQRFLASFPTISALASAAIDDVLAHWSGLGYYARGRNLHRAARVIAEKFDGIFPREYEYIIELPGIGRSTAAAICALAFHERRAILDGNVKRVLARYCGIRGSPIEKKIEVQLWHQAENLLPLSSALSIRLQDAGSSGAQEAQGFDRWYTEGKLASSDIAVYTQALMDMGATICTRGKPKCLVCPVQSDCVAFLSNCVAELPTARLRKVLPEKNTTFILLLHGNETLLEKRASHGIWGGLWCLPQLENGQGMVEEYVSGCGMVVKERKDLSAFTHTFTHFKLHISPVLLKVESKPQRVQELGSVWMNVEEALNAAIPAPVRRLLQELYL